MKQLRKVILSNSDISDKAKNKALQRYNHLSRQEAAAMATEIGTAIWLEEFNLRIGEGETILGKMVLGDRELGFFKMRKLGSELEFNIDDLSRSLGFSEDTKNETLRESQINHQQLKPDEIFTHPMVKKGLDCDSRWQIASILVNSVRGHGTPERCAQAESMVRFLLFKINPAYNLDYLLARIKLHYTPEIMLAANAIAQVKDLDDFAFPS